MTATRRGIFGLFAAGPAAVVAGDPAPEPEFFVGQIRAVHSHYEVKLAPHLQPWPPSATGATYAQTSLWPEAVAVLRHEQWNGTEWLPIEAPVGSET